MLLRSRSCSNSRKLSETAGACRGIYSWVTEQFGGRLPVLTVVEQYAEVGEGAVGIGKRKNGSVLEGSCG